MPYMLLYNIFIYAFRSNNASEDQKGNEAANEEKQVDNVEKTTDSSDEQNATKTDGGNAESPKKNVNEFEGVEKRYFKCHVCKKSMWDGTSFKKHLKGMYYNWYYNHVY